MGNSGVIIQARTGSQRLPDKVIRNFYKGKSILEIIIKNIKDNFAGEIIIATTESSKDDAIKAICEKENVACFRGSESDVLNRFVKAASAHNIDVIARVCADNPLLQAQSLNFLFENIEEKSDYAGFKLSNGLPTIKSHLGLWPEIVRYNALLKAESLTDENLYHEHVTNYLYENKNIFNIQLINAPELFFNRYDIRLTVDTIEDFELMQSFYSGLYAKDDFSLTAIYDNLKENPQYIEKMKKQINTNIK